MNASRTAWALRWLLTVLALVALCLNGASVLTGRGLMVSAVQDLRAFALCSGSIASVDFNQVGGDIDIYFRGGVPRERRFGTFGAFRAQRADRVGVWALDSVGCDFFMQCARAEGKPITRLWPFATVLSGSAGLMWWGRFARRARPGCCRLCGYDLAGNTSGVCPECGTRTPCLERDDGGHEGVLAPGAAVPEASLPEPRSASASRTTDTALGAAA